MRIPYVDLYAINEQNQAIPRLFEVPAERMISALLRRIEIRIPCQSVDILRGSGPEQTRE